MDAVLSRSERAEHPRSGLSRRALVLMAAAGIGGVAGGLFSTELFQAAVSVWSNYIVPAFFELLMSGIPFCA